MRIAVRIALYVVWAILWLFTLSVYHSWVTSKQAEVVRSVAGQPEDVAHSAAGFWGIESGIIQGAITFLFLGGFFVITKKTKGQVIAQSIPTTAPTRSGPTSRFCSECGAQIDAVAKFCWSCGAVKARPDPGRASEQISPAASVSNASRHRDDCPQETKEYLGSPLRIDQYLLKYRTTKQAVEKAISIGAIKGARASGWLWVQDKRIQKSWW